MISAIGVLAAPAPGNTSMHATARPTSKPPKPAFGRPKVPAASFVSATQSLAPGKHGKIAVRVAHAATCQLVLQGPRSARSGPYVAVLQQHYGVWTWRVPANASAGMWAANVSCPHGTATKRLSARIRVGGSVSATGPLVARGSMNISVGATPPELLAAGVAGKGGGGGLSR
jgi:hypothetical protein